MMSRITTVVACFIFLVGALLLPSLVLAGSATVAWQPNTEPDLAKYRVYWSTTAGVYGSYKAEVPKGTATYVANGLTEGQTYHFVLTAVDTSGNESGYSSPPATKTIQAGTPSVPAAPVLEYPANGSTVPGTSITFRWKASPGATQYVFRQWKQNGQLSIEHRVGNVTSYTVPWFSNSGYTNSWSVTALNAAGQGTASEKWTFTNGPVTTPAVPPAPALSAPASGANIAGTSVTFSWQAAQGATDYNLKVFNSSGAVAFDRWLGNVLTYNLTGFANDGQSHSWTVTARNAAGQGPASAQRSFVNGTVTQPTVPPAPVLTSPAGGANVAGTSVPFSWQAAQGATDYNLKLYNSSGALVFDRWLGNVFTYSIGGFGNVGQSYSWSVTARNAAGQGPASAQRSFVNGTSSTPSGAPVLLSPANGATVRGTSITFKWQKAPAQTYNRIRVYRSNGTVFYDRWISSNLSHTVRGFTNNGATYYWEIYPYNSSGLLTISPRWRFINR